MMDTHDRKRAIESIGCFLPDWELHNIVGDALYTGAVLCHRATGQRVLILLTEQGTMFCQSTDRRLEYGQKLYPDFQAEEVANDIRANFVVRLQEADNR